MKSVIHRIRKYLMEHLNKTTLLVGMIDKNITMNIVIQHDTYIEVIATLDYYSPKCKHCARK